MNTHERTQSWRANRGRRAASWLVLRHGDRIIAVFMMAIAVTALIPSLQQPFGSLSEPGPGLWTVALSVVMGALSILLLIFGRDVPILGKTEGRRDLLAYAAAMFVFAPLYSLLGFLPTAAVILFGLVRLIAHARIISSVITAVIGAAAVYLVFAVGLALPLRAF